MVKKKKMTRRFPSKYRDHSVKANMLFVIYERYENAKNSTDDGSPPLPPPCLLLQSSGLVTVDEVVV